MTNEEINDKLNGLDMDGWAVATDGVYKVLGNRTIYACPIPIFPTSIIENLDSGIERVELTFYKNRWRSIIVDRSVIANKSKILNLADMGIEVNSASCGDLVKYLAEVIAANIYTIKKESSKSVMGWIDSDEKLPFLPYSDGIRFDGDEMYGFLRNCIHEGGNEFAWLKHSKEVRQNLQMRLVMDASFAAPLIQLIGENSIVVHLWGGTGVGKSVALLCAMSIWGDPTFGKLTRTMNMTKNSMLSTAAFFQNLPFAGDELQTIKSKWRENYDDIIMCLTEGIDRSRMQGNQLLETKSWKTSFIFTGEEPIIKASSGGGAVNRVIQINTLDKMVADGNYTANMMRTNYGHAGRRYIDKLREIRPTLSKRFKTIEDGILKAVDTTDKQAGAMSLLLLADEIARECFFPEETALTIEQIRPYLTASHDVDVSERAYQYVVDLIAENYKNFTDESYSKWGKFDGDYCYLNKTVLSRELASAGYDLEAVKDKWKDKGYIIPASDGRIRHSTSIGGIRAQCVKLMLPTGGKDEELPD